MDVDGWNLLVATLALIGTVVAISYQYMRDRSAALPVLYLHPEQAGQEGVLRFVLRSYRSGDDTWRVRTLELVQPSGTLIAQAGSGPAQRVWTFHPPLEIKSGIAAFSADLPAGVMLMHLHVRAKVRLRSSSGRVATVYAEGWYA